MNQAYTVTCAKHLKTLRTFLNRWRGGTARLWKFQATHCHLTIRIERSGEHGNLHVICLGPEFIANGIAPRSLTWSALPYATGALSRASKSARYCSP